MAVVADDQRVPLPWYRDAGLALGAYAFASAIAALTIFVATGDAETIAAGLIAPLFLIPSILLYIILARLAPNRMWKDVGYLVPSLGVMGYCAVGIAMDVLGQLSGGSGLPLIMAVTFGIPAAITYYVLLAVDSGHR